ncbi:MAG: hypothetical protein KGJ57_21960 [Sphingomonadales bacterium]|nr:hypothetical protein [Sphingomonadales bacterium]MDE2172055.1 hypothetical protein [Sphingomonadales bacterium]
MQSDESFSSLCPGDDRRADLGASQKMSLFLIDEQFSARNAHFGALSFRRRVRWVKSSARVQFSLME